MLTACSRNSGRGHAYHSTRRRVRHDVEASSVSSPFLPRGLRPGAPASSGVIDQAAAAEIGRSQPSQHRWVHRADAGIVASRRAPWPKSYVGAFLALKVYDPRQTRSCLVIVISDLCQSSRRGLPSARWQIETRAHPDVPECFGLGNGSRRRKDALRITRRGCRIPRGSRSGCWRPSARHARRFRRRRAPPRRGSTPELSTPVQWSRPAWSAGRSSVFT